LPGGKKYEFRAESDGYIAISEFIDLQNLEESATKNVNLTLYPIETGIQYRINNIFFETGKWELLEDSFVELRRLVDFLKNNQNYKIKIYGHTDDVGTNQFNLNLSIKRAESVKNFLIENGIENNRIFIKGYGKTKPIVSNNTEEGRQKNRRVEFELINR
jgi:outer membrane protein OmpA-like peptidoglycan-associated protein